MSTLKFVEGFACSDSDDGPICLLDDGNNCDEEVKREECAGEEPPGKSLFGEEPGEEPPEKNLRRRASGEEPPEKNLRRRTLGVTGPECGNGIEKVMKSVI